MRSCFDPIYIGFFLCLDKSLYDVFMECVSLLPICLVWLLCLDPMWLSPSMVGVDIFYSMRLSVMVSNIGDLRFFNQGMTWNHIISTLIHVDNWLLCGDVLFVPLLFIMVDLSHDWLVFYCCHLAYAMVKCLVVSSIVSLWHLFSHFHASVTCYYCNSIVVIIFSIKKLFLQVLSWAS